MDICQTVTIEGRIDAQSGTEFDFHSEPDNNGPLLAGFTFYIEGFQFLSPDPLYRWWSNPTRLVLTPGSFSITAPFYLDQWSSADGTFTNQTTEATEKFLTTLSAPVRIGGTFGGGSFFGHGVRTQSGLATFVITRFAVL